MDLTVLLSVFENTCSEKIHFKGRAYSCFFVALIVGISKDRERTKS